MSVGFYTHSQYKNIEYVFSEDDFDLIYIVYISIPRSDKRRIDFSVYIDVTFLAHRWAIS